MNEGLRNILITFGILAAIVIFVRFFWVFVIIAIIFFALLKNKVIKEEQLREFYKKSNLAQKIADARKKEHIINYDKINSFTFNPKTMKKISWKVWTIIIASIVVIFIIIDGLVSVPAGHVAVVYDRGRGVLDNELPPGLHLKIPLWQTATIMDTRLQAYTMSIADSEGHLYGDDSIESLTKDGQKVYVDVTIQYRIIKEEASWIYDEIGNDEVYLVKVVRPATRNVIRDVVTGFDSTNLFTQETRTEAQDMMAEQLGDKFGDSKIILESVLLRNIKFSDVYLQAIEDKQVAQQRIQKAEYERQEAEKLKEKKIIEAQAEAESIRLKGETLKANPQVIEFEFVQKMAPNINWGILPSGSVPFIDIKSMVTPTN